MLSSIETKKEKKRKEIKKESRKEGKRERKKEENQDQKPHLSMQSYTCTPPVVIFDYRQSRKEKR